MLAAGTPGSHAIAQIVTLPRDGAHTRLSRASPTGGRSRLESFRGFAIYFLSKPRRMKNRYADIRGELAPCPPSDVFGDLRKLVTLRRRKGPR